MTRTTDNLQSFRANPDASTVHKIPDLNFPSEIHLFKSVNDLPAADWDSCLSQKGIFLTRRYLNVAELSSLPGMSFRYAILYLTGKPAAILYFQLINLSDSGLGGVLNLEEYGGLAGSVSNRINDLVFNPGNGKHSYLLVCGNLLLSGEHAIAAIDDQAYQIAVSSVSTLKKSILVSLESDAKIVAFMVKDFYSEKNQIAMPILKKDYFSLNTDPEMIFEVNPEWMNFDDYLSALSSKYRIRANNSRKKLEGLTIQDLSLEEVIESESQIFGLSESVMRKAPVKLAKPSSAYFINLKKEFKNHYQIKAYYSNDKMVAFTSGLFNKHHFEAHYIGLDYHYNKPHSLYQNLLYSFIEDAIRVKSERLYFGRTALEIKSTTGAKPYDLACYFRFANRIINTLAKPLVSSTGPGDWIPRDPFRQSQSE